MIIQYLFKDNKYKDELNKYQYKYDVIPNGGENKGRVTRTIIAEKTIKDLNDDCRIVQFKIEGFEKRETAKHLSIIHEEMQKYEAFTLGNEASEYYNQALYPLINTFEMRLRKFLFLVFSLKENSSRWNKVRDLEKIDFYTIYSRLFTSTDFNKKLYQLFSEKHNYTKAQIHDLIENIDEKILWDQVVDNRLSIIKEKFQLIKEYRNDVMHSHNIGYKRYKDIHKLINEVNRQLSVENDNIVCIPNDIQHDESVAQFIEQLLNEYGQTPMSVVESWLKTSGTEEKDYIKKLLESD